MALGELDAAEAAFRAALTVAPGYTDAHVGLARLLSGGVTRRGASRSGRGGCAKCGDSELRNQLADASSGPRWQIDVDAAYSWLDGPQPDWRELAFQLRRSEGRAAIGARIEYARRFARDDVYGEAQIDYGLSEAGRLYARLGGTPNADFRPEWQIGLGGSLRVNGGPNATILTLDGRQARFAVGDVKSLTPVSNNISRRALLAYGPMDQPFRRTRDASLGVPRPRRCSGQRTAAPVRGLQRRSRHR